jgi:hypothetical protein
MILFHVNMFTSAKKKGDGIGAGDKKELMQV